MYCIQYLSRVLDVIRFRDRQDPESESLSNVNMQLNIKRVFVLISVMFIRSGESRKHVIVNYRINVL